MKICTYIPVWKRREITEQCFKALLRSYKQAPKGFSFDTVVVASSEEDEQLARSFGFDVHLCENKPLGSKFNSGVEYALESSNWDYLFQLNSDNILAIDFWEPFKEFFGKKMLFFGVDRVYFYNSETRDMREFIYGLGCGIRFIHRYIIEIAGYIEKDGEEIFELWDKHINSGLDNNSDEHIVQRAQYGQFFARSKKYKRPMVVDIKSGVNIHLFEEFKHAKRIDELHRKQIMRRFPELLYFEQRFNK